jgi:hypothetical protein
MKTVEDCIEILAGIQQHDAKFQLAREDYNLITSLARQTFRGTGYTDRQCELAKEKVLNYRQQFENNKLDIDIALTSTRLPLREIDRSRWIKIVEQPSDVIYSSDHIGPWLAVRFIFQKKLITAIESIKRSIGDGVYDKKEKVHYFPFNERTVFALVDAFNETNSFVIEDTVKDYYEKLQEMKNNKHKYIPGIYGLKLKNLHNKSFDYAISSIGEPSIENLCHYYDQKDRLGLFHFDDIDLQESLKSLTPLSKKVIQRNKNQICLSPKEYTVNHLAEVVFRLDNDISEGKEFNQYIKQHNLNNLVDKNTKIVYISNNKVPKPLLKSEWFPITAITTSSNRSYGAKTDSYIDMLDLVIHYDDDVSTWKRNKIEKL